MDRRTALTQLASLALGGAAALGLSDSAFAHDPQPADSRVASITLERADGTTLPSFWHNGRLWVEGHLGDRYGIRVTNNTGRRIEAVVSVDGRDAISGQVANYKSQRGYVIDAYDSVTIDGFRQSMDHVAAFRFSRLRDSYSARRGTAQNVGVIGLAVFEERPRPRPRRRPVTPRRYDHHRHYDYEDRSAPDAYPGARGKSGASKRKSGGGYGRGAPAAESSARGGLVDDYSTHHHHHREARNLGTEYGETRTSSVRETTFTRRNARSPDSLLTVHYDSYEGLVARGVLHDHYDHYDHHDHRDHYRRRTYPRREFAAPPPPRRY